MTSSSGLGGLRVQPTVPPKVGVTTRWSNTMCPQQGPNTNLQACPGGLPHRPRGFRWGWAA
eukprot:2305839-Lingulodinium_polyedra.AAC.1